MILLIIVSIVIIWLQITSLSMAVRTNSKKNMLDSIKKMKDFTPVENNESSLLSGPAIISIGLIFLLNLIEIIYFIYCVHYFGGMIITLGASMLVGYTLYSIIRFIPDLRKMISKPGDFLEKTRDRLDNAVNIFFTSVEIIFCIYVLYLAISDKISG